MNTFVKVVQVMLLIALSQILVGCLVVNCGKLPNIKELPDVSRIDNKPTVLLVVNFYQLKKKQTIALESITLREAIKPTVEKVTKESNLFSAYKFASFTREDVDYIIQIDMSQYAKTGAKISAFITGFTLGCIPGYGKDHYKLSCTVIDKDENELLFEYYDCNKNYMFLFLLPFGFTAIHSAEKKWENMLKVFYNDLIENEVLI